MQNFDVFFKLHFDSVEISDDELNLYTAENIKRLAAVPRFSAITASLLDAHTDYFGAITDEATNAAIQKGFTRTMENAREAFAKTAGRHEGAIRSKFGEGSPEYLRFFPTGLTEYREATMENIDQKLTRLAKAFTDLGSKLDPEVVADFTAASVAGASPRGVIPAFQTARAAQLSAKGANNASKTPSATTRAALELECQKALLTVALDSLDKAPAERTELRRLFPQNLLEDRQTTTEATPPTNPVI